MMQKFKATVVKGCLMCVALSVPQLGWAGDFDSFSMPVSNPVYNGDARNVTMVRPIMLWQSLPDRIKVNIGGVESELDLGGDVQGAAMQFSYAFNERFSLVAVKDGYINCEPDNTLSDHSGWIDIAAGLQYSFLYEPAQNFIMTGRLVYESTSGNSDVYQRNGDGNLAPSILFIKGFDKLQLSGTVGFVLPFDSDEENTLFYDSWNVGYAVTDWFKPLIELNHFHVLSSGSRNLNGFVQNGGADDLVAAISTFNGCDIINLGGEHSGDNADQVTMAFGSRFRINKWIDVGAAYEIPLTSDKETLMQERILVDVMFTMAF
ncbi:MAG: hypothetical protein Q7U64_14665 [Desulfocapsaceae bacterium]|nr:hypothetical protein [Desulfocapsaceae bacterium]